MNPDALSVPVIIFLSSVLTGYLSGIVPKGRTRKVLVFVPFVLAIAMAALFQLTMSGEVTALAFWKAFVSGALALVLHNVRKAGALPVSPEEPTE